MLGTERAAMNYMQVVWGPDVKRSTKLRRGPSPQLCVAVVPWQILSIIIFLAHSNGYQYNLDLLSRWGVIRRM